LLLPAFDTPSGLPYSYLNIKTGAVRPNQNAVLAEFGTLHLEFLYLSDITGNPVFREKALAIRKVLKDIVKPKGLYWYYMDVTTGKFSESTTEFLFKVRFKGFYVSVRVKLTIFCNALLRSRIHRSHG